MAPECGLDAFSARIRIPLMACDIEQRSTQVSNVWRSSEGVQSKIDLIARYQYTEKEVDEMVQRKNAAGVGSSKVPLGVQRVRLERDIKAAREMKNFEKAIMLEAKLQRLLNENEARQSRKSDDVLRITEINRRNREANLKQDLQAQELNDAMREKMTSAEKLQFIRANSKKMFLSRDKIEANLTQGKLVKLADGRIMTLNKVHEIEALPEDLVRNNANQNSVLECEIGLDGRPTGKIEIDEERLLAKQREKKKKDLKDKANMESKETKVEFVGQAPTNVTEIANATIRIQDDDGTWMTLRPASEILRQMREKSVVSTELKASRKGLTVKEYFDRVKRQRVEAPAGSDD
uniref:RNA polymeraseassociated protein RTF1 putative n=2 Tax=Albugo TaxID=65356 RepID=F0X2U4_9STRA|nr:RNA polymeraseassociated protein RTF1 putative [Albugo laibachii Nc14]|eukprot:CCA28257.1 RNA polymeraseassociated protein RTF1 putative [Albugo laibachii Nc14]